MAAESAASPPSQRREERVAFVTGGGSGIGRATARAFAREGARVAVCDVDPQGGEATARAIEDETGNEALALRVDVSREFEVATAIDRVIRRFGRLDCAFNNAGILGDAFVSTEACTAANWDRVIETNLKGVWLCLKHEIAAIRRTSGRGAVVNMSSIAGLSGSMLGVAYAASKHGIIGLTRTAAAEYAPLDIRINAVCPGPVRTPMLEPFLRAKRSSGGEATTGVSVHRLGTPDEVAEAVLWLCSNAASLVTGQALTLDGGMTARAES